MLVVLNRHKSSENTSEALEVTNPFLEKALYLETCLRKTFILSESNFENLQLENPELLESFDIHKGYASIEYLVKVLSGLESPVMGETEVLGQFKKQVIPQLEEKPDLEGMIQFVLNLVKLVRTKHLVGLGSQSYGSMVRRILKADQHILFVGAGVLTESILPWVKASKNIMLSVRSLERYQQTDLYKENKDLLALSLDEKLNFDFPLNVVVCAPIESSVLKTYLEGVNVHNIIDLREESKADPIEGVSCKVTNLEKVFQEVQAGPEKKEKIIKTIEEDISNKIEERFVKYRPFGWDDLCL